MGLRWGLGWGVGLRLVVARVGSDLKYFELQVVQNGPLQPLTHGVLRELSTTVLRHLKTLFLSSQTLFRLALIARCEVLIIF